MWLQEDIKNFLCVLKSILQVIAGIEWDNYIEQKSIKKRNFVSLSGHVMFHLWYKQKRNFTVTAKVKSAYKPSGQSGQTLSPFP